MIKQVRVGDKFPVWWRTGEKDANGENLAAVIAVEDYRGAYPQWFDKVLTLAAPNTRSGALQMTYDTRSGPRHGRIIPAAG